MKWLKSFNVFLGLLATVANDLTIRLFDVVACRLVRNFGGHTDRITDLCFSEDGKWLLSSSMDGSLRIWDVMLARQIGLIEVDVPITALSLSPNMDVLATTHVDKNGVYLWWVSKFISCFMEHNFAKIIFYFPIFVASDIYIYIYSFMVFGV